MNHHYKKETISSVATSFTSIIFSVLASSQHWIHMGILFY